MPLQLKKGSPRNLPPMISEQTPEGLTTVYKKKKLDRLRTKGKELQEGTGSQGQY